MSEQQSNLERVTRAVLENYLPGIREEDLDPEEGDANPCLYLGHPVPTAGEGVEVYLNLASNGGCACLHDSTGAIVEELEDTMFAILLGLRLFTNLRDRASPEEMLTLVDSYAPPPGPYSYPPGPPAELAPEED